MKGVMSIKNSNRLNDRLIISCGGDDEDSRMVIWEALERIIISETQQMQKDYRARIYNTNIIYFSDTSFDLDAVSLRNDREAQENELSKSKF